MARYVKAEDLLSQAQKAHKDGNLDEAEKLYNAILNQHFWNANLYYLLGTLHMNKGNHGLGATLLKLCTQAMPEFGEAWNNLAICLKLQWHKEDAADAFAQAMKLMPGDANIPSNWSGVYINEGEPQKCLLLAEKALEIDPNHKQSLWHKGLALLELQQWAEAWDCHEYRLEPGSGCQTAVRNYAKDGMTPWWDGRSKGLVVIHGEQGLGDEVMFATCIKDAQKTGAELVFECSPRMQELFERSLPGVRVIGTHRLDGSEWRDGRKVDYKVALGSLPKFWRRSEDAFPGTPYLKPDPRKVRYWRKRLAQLGPKPKIGIAWQGGAHTTRMDLRSVMLPLWKDVLSQDADFISLQYTKAATDEVKEMKDEGFQIYHWKEAAEAKCMDDYAALESCCDLVISVCQTAIHLAGALGVPCWCLTPAAPAWRYGVTGNMPWYNSVDLIRQHEPWEAVMSQVAVKLKEYLSKAA